MGDPLAEVDRLSLYRLKIRSSIGTAVAPLPGHTLSAAKAVAAAWRVMLGGAAPKFFTLEIVNAEGESLWAL